MTSRAERIGVALIVMASFLLFSLYSILTPLFEASDELWHYPMVQHFAEGGGLPVQHKGQTDAEAPWRQEGSQPPLYYWITALISAPFDSSNWRELRRINPHSDMGVPTRDGNANAILHTPAEALPWMRAALAVRMARFASIVMSTATVFFSYLVAREMFRDKERKTTDDFSILNSSRDPGSLKVSPKAGSGQFSILRLVTMIFVACVPMFAFISGAINNDNAAVMFSTIGVWWALRLMQRNDPSTGSGQALSIKSAVVAGAITGLGVLSKSSALGLVGLFGFAAVLSQKLEVRSKKFWLRLSLFTFILLLVTFIISGWWFIRNQQLYGDLLGWNAFLDVVGRREPPATLAQLWTEREGFVWAYWGVFGTLNVIMAPIIYDALNALVAVALVGIGIRIVYAVTSKQPCTTYELRAILLCAFWVTLVFIALLRWTSLTPASQGRLMFPCISVIAAAMAYGLWRVHRAVLLIGCVLMAALAVAVPFIYIAPAYARPPSVWTERLPQPVDVTFGGALTLVEAGQSAETISPGDEVTLRLNWKLDKPLPENYSVFVHLIDEDDVIVAQRDMHPGQGNIATSEAPAGYTWSDHYTLPIPAFAPAPKQLHWTVGVYDFQAGERLKLSNGDDRVIFGAFQLVPRMDDAPLLRYANGVELFGYTMSAAAPKPGDTLTVTMRWRAAQPLAQDLILSLQVLDENANKIAQQDLNQPLTQWKPGETVETNYSLQLNADAPPGVYRLLLVWYASDDFSRVGVYDARGQFADDQIELTRIRVH